MPVDQLNKNEGVIRRWDEHAKTYDDESKQFSSAVTHFVDWELLKGYLPQNKEARGQGVGTAITLAPLLDARGLGFPSAFCKHLIRVIMFIAGSDFMTSAN